MYDTNFIVKYKSIEEELINKIEHETKEDIGYTREDIYSICEELYRHELLTVFQVERLDEAKMGDTMIEIWNKIQLDAGFMKVMEAYSKKLLLDVNNINSFIMMFNYDIFFLLHNCICKCIENKEMDTENINQLLIKINNM